MKSNIAQKQKKSQPLQAGFFFAQLALDSSPSQANIQSQLILQQL